MDLARDICSHLRARGTRPDVIIDPLCGEGSLLLSSIEQFPMATTIIGGDVDPARTQAARLRLQTENGPVIRIHTREFFEADWGEVIRRTPGNLLLLANPPWIDPANAASRAVGESSDLRPRALAALAGSANSELPDLMTMEMMTWLAERTGELAVVLKSTAARRILLRAEELSLPIASASLAPIDAKAHFGTNADLCLMHVVFDHDARPTYGYDCYDKLGGTVSQHVQQRNGVPIADSAAYDRFDYLLGHSPVKWRSGLKHDAAAIMELSRPDGCLQNGLDEVVEIEDTHVFPLMKGSDVANGRAVSRSVIVTQFSLADSPEHIQSSAPSTWSYLQRHSDRLQARRSRIYSGRPPFSIFGVGEYAFLNWKIAICALYPEPRFALVGPAGGRPVMLDDTTYYVSFSSEHDARDAHAALTSEPYLRFLRAHVFADRKRPITAKLLNSIDWTRAVR